MKRPLDTDTIATYTIVVVGLVLSYSKLTDLSLRAGYDERMAHLWPLIVDGLALVATRGVMRLRSARSYAWLLLVAGTAVSIVAAVASVMLPAGPLPGVAAACVVAIPPLCVPFALHLAILMRRESHDGATGEVAQVSDATHAAEVAQLEVAGDAPTELLSASNFDFAMADVAPVAVPQDDAPDPVALDIAPEERRDAALHLLATTDHSQRAVARMVGVTETSVRRWVRHSRSALVEAHG